MCFIWEPLHVFYMELPALALTRERMEDFYVCASSAMQGADHRVGPDPRREREARMEVTLAVRTVRSRGRNEWVISRRGLRYMTWLDRATTGDVVTLG